MKRVTWSLAAGLTILASGTIALLISAGIVRSVRAQGQETAPAPNAKAPPANAAPPAAGALPAPTTDLPPPSADLPPETAPAASSPSSAPAAPPSAPPAGPTELPPPTTADLPMGTPQGAPPMPQQGGATMPPPLDSSQDPGLKTQNPEGFVYDPSGRRDPFLPPKGMMQGIIGGGNSGHTGNLPPDQGQGLGLEGQGLGNGDPLLSYYLRDFKLIGVMWDVSEPRAMIRAPNNRVYTIRLKMKLGRENAVVAAIRENEVVVVEPDDKGNYKNGDARSLKIRN